MSAFITICAAAVMQRQKLIRAYVAMVKKDGGVVRNIPLTNAVQQLYKSWGQSPDKYKLTICPEMGRKDNVISPTQTGVPKLYSLNDVKYGVEFPINGEFADSNADGIADSWSNNDGSSTFSIVTGNGHIGNAQKAVSISGAYPGFQNPNKISIGKKYIISFLYRSNSGFYINVGSVNYQLQTNTGNAIRGMIEIVSSTSVFAVYQVSIGTYIEISNLSVREVFSADSAVQATQLNQPTLGGTIAPNERLSLVNGNNQTKSLTHTPIAFASNESWSITTVLNWNGTTTDNAAYVLWSGNTYLRLRGGNLNKFDLFSGLNSVDYVFGSSNTSPIIGKNTVLTINCDGFGHSSLFLNGILIQTISMPLSAISIRSIFAESSFIYHGSISFHSIKAFALTALQVAQEATLLQSYFPAVPSVSIGFETERCVNGGFDADANWTKGAGQTIAGGKLNIQTTSLSDTSQVINSYVGGRYLVSFEVSNFITGSIALYIGYQSGAVGSGLITANGTYSFYTNPSTGAPNTLYISAKSPVTNCSVDNISVKELPQTWATSNCQMVCTPQGNVIPEMVDNANVEKVVNGGFDTDTVWSKASGVTISGGLLNINNTTAYTDLISEGVLTSPIGKWFKVIIDITAITSGSITVKLGGYDIVDWYNVAGIYTKYIQVINPASDTTVRIASRNVGFVGVVNNVSVQQIGWSGSQELYDGIYTQTAEADSAVEKITVAADRDFSSDTGFWAKRGTATINGGALNMLNSVQYSDGVQINVLNANAWYKVTVTISNYVSGQPIYNDGGAIAITLPAANGTYVTYFKPATGSFRLTTASIINSFSFDNVSVKELGITANVNNYLYAAVKAAAMWCSYNNDASLAVIYGKLYNGFAIDLIAMDIAYYNTANPTVLWGYDVPTETQFNTLIATCGGVNNAGSALKLGGTIYSLIGNTGNNSSGFSAIVSGYRTEAAMYNFLQSYLRFWGKNKYSLRNNHDSNIVTIDNAADKRIGYSLRLIKV